MKPEETRERNEAELSCSMCGCGFIAKYPDGLRICLYCPNKWNTFDFNNNLNPIQEDGRE